MSKSLSDFNIGRTVFLFKDFNQESSQELIDKILKLDSLNNEEINIIINSYGGEVFSLFAILDTLKSIKSPVNTICLGEADSCGAVLLSAGAKRYIGENSRAMIHEVSTFTWGKVSEIEESMLEIKAINERLIDILATNSNQDKTKLSKLMLKDTFLSAKEAVKLGIADEILEEPAEDDAVFTNEVKSFVNSFHGSAKDGTYGTIMYNSIIMDKVAQNLKRDNSQKASITKDISLENIKKGEKIMNKEEMILALKDNFNIDVENLLASSNKLGELENALKISVDAKQVAEKALNDLKASQEKANIDRLLDDLILEGKATQATNEVNRVAFEALGYESSKALSLKMPLIAKFDQTGSSSISAEKEELSVVEQEDATIKAYAKEHNVSYEKALMDIRANLKKGDK